MILLLICWSVFNLFGDFRFYYIPFFYLFILFSCIHLFVHTLTLLVTPISTNIYAVLSFSCSLLNTHRYKYEFLFVPLFAPKHPPVERMQQFLRGLTQELQRLQRGVNVFIPEVGEVTVRTKCILTCCDYHADPMFSCRKRYPTKHGSTLLRPNSILYLINCFTICFPVPAHQVAAFIVKLCPWPSSRDVESFPYKMASLGLRCTFLSNFVHLMFFFTRV